MATSRLRHSKPKQPAARRPTCDGVGAAKLPASDPLGKMKRQFVAAYHKINRSYARLLALRAKPHRQAGADERSVLQSIEKALLAKNALEDKYAPYGIDVSPVFEEGFIVDLGFCSRFTIPPSPVSRRSSSALVVLPFPRARRRRPGRPF